MKKQSLLAFVTFLCGRKFRSLRELAHVVQQSGYYPDDVMLGHIKDQIRHAVDDSGGFLKETFYGETHYKVK